MKNVTLIMALCVFTVTALSPPFQICHLGFKTNHTMTSIERKLVQTDNGTSTGANFVNFAAQAEKERLEKPYSELPLVRQQFSSKRVSSLFHENT